MIEHNCFTVYYRERCFSARNRPAFERQNGKFFEGKSSH